MDGVKIMANIAIFLAEGFEEIEGLMVVDLLRRAGITVDMVSISDSQTVSGSHKITVTADKLIKDIDFEVQYDINNYQDVAQQVFPKLRTYCDKYNVTFLVTHHLNKTGKTLGSIALDATVDGRITLIENKSNKKYVKLQTINRDFPELDMQLKKLDNLIFQKINSIEEDELSYEMTSFIKYVASQKDIDFTCTDIVLKANIPMSPKRFGRLLNNNIELLESEGVHITKCRTADSRFYHATFIEPSQNEDE